MVHEVRKLVDDYVAWLKDKTKVQKAPDDWAEITTPFLDRHNDHLQIYVRRDNGKFKLSDDGYTVRDLQQSGCKLDSKKRQDLLNTTLAGFGIQLKDDRLETVASKSDFPSRQHNLIQAMLAVNDLFYLSVPMVTSLFYEDVVAWLDDSDIRYTPNIKFMGKSGFDHQFGFVIPKSRKQPERIVDTITRPSRDTAQNLILKWLDTKEVRPPESLAFAMLNDQDQPVNQQVLEALGNYDINPVLWSKRDEARDQLAA
jgi:Domain of unknown function DUF1829/Domain of unknown function DUF1828